jgi:predicted nuclease with TOPRIM domain
MNLQKTTVPGLYRNPESNALVNTDTNALQAYKLKKQKYKEMEHIKSSVEENRDKINKMETDLSEIKQMLRQLLQNKEV